MKKIFSLLVAALMLLPLLVTAENEVPAEIRDRLKNDMLLRNSSQGTKFIVTLPPNEMSGYDYGDEACELYITAQVPTTVSVYNSSSKILSKQIAINSAMGVSVVKLDPDLFEIREEETVNGAMTIIIESQHPVSVYVMNSRFATTDGYMALPVSAWGKEYIHCSYYDNHEGLGNAYAGGFIVMAAEDNTSATISARGIGGDYDTTSKGHKIGDAWNITLNSGEYYMVRGAANTDGMFDLTGTSIKADKPIGIISFHERAGLPWAIDNSRDCLNEMVLPVSSWGTKYATVSFDRGAGGKGDIFRIVASEPNTKFSIKWYDTKNSTLKNAVKSELKNAGDFFEYITNPSVIAGTDITSITGPSVFEADKPIMVMQYSPEETWDEAAEALDPFMVVVTPVEEYTMATVFQVTSNKNFLSNKVNLIVRGDTTDNQRNDSLLKSVIIDGVPLYIVYPKLLTNRIPETDLFFVQGWSVETGAHYITANTKFGGVLYGRKAVDSYGWPLSMSVDYNGKIDTLTPECVISNFNNKYSIRVTDLEDAQTTDPNLAQSGITEYPVLLSGSYNFSAPSVASGFTKWPPSFDNEFYLNVEDVAKDAKAVFMVVDIKGNYKLDSISYKGGTSSVTDNNVDGYAMQEISPNPVNDNQFMIRFSIGDNTNTTKIEMLNMNGEVVKLISNELMNAGDHTLNVSTNALPSGAYLVKITSGAYVASQKVVVLK